MTTAGELREHLFGRNCFAAIGLAHCKEQLRLLFGREVEAAFIVFGEDRHRSALFEGDPGKNDLSAYHSSSCHFHVAEDTPNRVALRRDANV